MKESKDQLKPTDSDQESVWQKTQHSNLIRYVPSGMYFARLRVDGKLIRASLKTNTLSVAVLRLADRTKEERQRAEGQEAVALGKMTFHDAMEVFRSRLESDQSIKPRTVEYRKE